MPRTTTKLQQEADLAVKSIGGSALLQEWPEPADSEWVNAVSYWCDYLTIIDVQGQDDQDLRPAC